MTRAMAAGGGFPALAPGDNPAGRVIALPARAALGITSAAACTRLAMRAPWHHGGAVRGRPGSSFAIIFAVAARFVYPLRLDAPGFLICGLDLLLAGDARAAPDRPRVSAVAGGAAERVVDGVVFLLLGLWAAAIPDIREFRVRRNRAARPFRGDALRG